ncbi:MAG TPA: ATP-binding protein [Cyclobacteriaceae bacterium]|nr:ATP-binding protein [Cyclobacteriaceae bacterium]
MDIFAFKRNRISFVVPSIFIASLLLFVFSLFSALQRSDQVEESQLRLIVDNLQLENRIVFSSIESAVKLEGKKIESGGHEILTGKSDISSLKSLIDVTDKVAAIGIISEDGEEFAIQKRNNLFATYYYHSALDSLAKVTVWNSNKKKEVPDTLVGNRMYYANIFQVYANETSGKQLWRPASNLPGYAGRKGLSASILVTDTITKKKYIVIFFVPFKRMMTNTVKVGYKKGEVFIFRNDSLYFNFDGTSDSASGFDTTKYFVSWKDISDKKHSEAIRTWQSLDRHDSIRIARFKSDGVNYYAAFSSIIPGDDGTYYAMVVPSASLPTLFRSKSGAFVLGAFILLLGTGIVFAIAYVKNSNKVRFVPLTADAVKQMISLGESDLLEFKSTIRTNLYAGKPGKEIELAWLKSVVAFCNTEGGTILIGVKDNGEILGLEADNFLNDDKCLLHVQNLISEHVGVEHLSYVRFSLLAMGDKKILAVQCIPLKRIMLLKSSGREQFYVRSGPSSIELPMSKVLEYVNDRKKTF